jgi:siderophore synthetase component
MTCGTVAGTLADAAAHAEAQLTAHAPHLVTGYRAALGPAADTVGRRLRGALVREGLGDARARHAHRGSRHGFDRVEFAAAGVDDPADLLPDRLAGAGRRLAAELGNAVVNLAIATARRNHLPQQAGPVDKSRTGGPTGDPDADAIAWERLAITGHNLHPCGRTRIGWDVADVLAHDLEAGATRVGFVAVRRDAHCGDDLGDALSGAYPHLPPAPDGYLRQPVHAWQRDTVLPARYPHLLRDGTLRVLDGDLPAVPTAALRTLLLPPAADGARRYLKVSLDIQVTSTRRSISVASTRNGPAVSALLHRLVADDPDGHRLLLLAETAGAAVGVGSGRDLSAILRDGLTGRLGPERVVPGGALPATDPRTGRSVVAGLVAEFARTRGRRDDAGAAAAFLDAYARLLLPPLLRLTTRHGVALEAHLQNCLPTFVAGVPHRLAVRDFAGLRLHRARLAAAGLRVPLWPGSVVGTDDAGTLRAKLGYTALQAHLGELVVRLVESHGLDEDTAWRAVRAVVDETYEPLRADPRVRDAAHDDHAAFTAARVPHKALVRMRLGGPGDTYVDVRNPLHAAA